MMQHPYQNMYQYNMPNNRYNWHNPSNQIVPPDDKSNPNKVLKMPNQQQQTYNKNYNAHKMNNPYNNHYHSNNNNSNNIDHNNYNTDNQYHHEEKEKEKQKQQFNFFDKIITYIEKYTGIKLTFDDILLGVLIIVLLLEKSNDNTLLIALAFILLTGRD